MTAQLSILPYAEFEPGAAGFVVCTPHGDDWAMPAWDEQGFPDLGAVFPTVAAAQDSIRAEGFL